MWNRLRFIRFLQVSQIFQRRKSDANKQDFENKFNLRCHAQSTPKTTGILTKVFSTSGPNLVALAWTGDELSRRQAQNGVNFDFEVKFDLEGQGQSPPKTIGILTKVFYIYGRNLVILAETGHELSRGQARDWHTDGHTHTQTDAGNDNTRRPILASGKKQKESSKSSVLRYYEIKVLLNKTYGEQQYPSDHRSDQRMGRTLLDPHFGNHNSCILAHLLSYLEPLWDAGPKCHDIE